MKSKREVKRISDKISKDAQRYYSELIIDALNGLKDVNLDDHDTKWIVGMADDKWKTYCRSNNLDVKLFKLMFDELTKIVADAKSQVAAAKANKNGKNN